MKNPFKPKTEIPSVEAKGKKRTKFSSPMKLVKGTRFVSFLFIGCSILIAAGILWAANIYYNIDTGEIVMEEIERTTGLIRAVGGVIIGGTATSTLDAGVAFEVASSSAVLLSGADQELRFSGGTNYYVGFRAPTSTLTTTTVYTWPTADGSSDYLLKTSGTGTLSWISPGDMGLGTISAVGNVTTGAAFTSDGTQGTSLWFYDAQGRGRLTITDLTAVRTYTLPDLTGTIALQNAGNLGSGGVLFADGGLISTSTYFTWSTTSRALSLGSNGNTGQLRIYSSAGGGYYLGFAANSGMATNTVYTWPADFGTNNYVLTTDGTSGTLTWKSVTGAGGLDTFGSPQGGQVAFFYDSDTLTGTSTFTWSTSSNMLTLGVGLISPLIQSSGALTLQSLSGNILLDPSTDIVQLATSTYIRTQGGYEIGATGTQILREMIPIFGFDLPSQTATTSYVQISRVIEDYPFSATTTGTTRIHKFAIRYADATTTASTTWRVWNVTDSATTTTFEVPPSAGTDVEKGEAYITADITIPTDTDDWRLDLMTSGATIRVYQIFLAAYDQIQ